MSWLYFLIAGLGVVAIAVVAIGKVTGEMATQRPPAVYSLPAAVSWIGARLPDEVTARISFADLEQILTWHLDWFASVGVASQHGQELGGVGVMHEGAVAVEQAAVDSVVAKAMQASTDIDAVDVVCVLDLQMAYLAEIGAVGDAVVKSDDTPGADVVD